MARINNGRNGRRKAAMERAQKQLDEGGYYLSNGGYTPDIDGSVFIKNNDNTIQRLKQEIETLKTRIH
jgi:hypothetical protein